MLDEPAPQQSDPALLTLQLRQLSRQAAGDANEVVGKLAHGEAGLAKRLDAWIASTAQVGCVLACMCIGGLGGHVMLGAGYCLV